MHRLGRSSAPIEHIRVSTFVIPTDGPESDGTYEWSSTTLVLVTAEAASTTGLGYTYADSATAELIADRLAEVVCGQDALSTPKPFYTMRRAVRNLGYPGIASMAVAAVDAALWDLKARLLGLPVSVLLGMVRETVPVYGSGGFTSYSEQRLAEQLQSWVDLGIVRAKMKVGREPRADVARVRAAREAMGPDAELFVDANGAYSRKEGTAMNGPVGRKRWGVLESDVPIVVQHTRLDSRQAENALPSTIAFADDG